MIYDQADYTDILKSTLEERKLYNSAYSLRALARDLNMESANLSKILSGQKGLSEEKALIICEKLGFTDEESSYFCDLVNVKHARSRKKRELAKSRLESYLAKSSVREIKEDVFKIISDWYHYATLELITIKGFKSDIKWIAKKLSISSQTAQDAIDRLKNLELIEIKNGKILSTGVQLETTNGVSSKSIKKLNKQLIKKAESAITGQNVNERHLSTLTLAVSREDIKEYGELIEKFKREFDQFSIKQGKKNKPDEVYSLTMQFTKLTT